MPKPRRNPFDPEPGPSMEHDWQSAIMQFAPEDEAHCAVCRVVVHGADASPADLWAVIVNFDRQLAKSQRLVRQLVELGRWIHD